MKRAEHYEGDILFFFEGKPEALALYQCLLRRMEERFPEAAVRVQKTQVSFYGRHLFAMVSLPRRRKEQGILVSLGSGGGVSGAVDPSYSGKGAGADRWRIAGLDARGLGICRKQGIKNKWRKSIKNR